MGPAARPGEQCGGHPGGRAAALPWAADSTLAAGAESGRGKRKLARWRWGYEAAVEIPNSLSRSQLGPGTLAQGGRIAFRPGTERRFGLSRVGGSSPPAGRSRQNGARGVSWAAWRPVAAPWQGRRIGTGSPRDCRVGAAPRSPGERSALAPCGTPPSRPSFRRPAARNVGQREPPPAPAPLPSFFQLAVPRAISGSPRPGPAQYPRLPGATAFPAAACPGNAPVHPPPVSASRAG